MSTETRPRPPSVEAVLAEVRPRLAETAAHEALVGVARAVVGAERARLAGGGDGRDAAGLADEVVSRLDGLRGANPATTINASGVPGWRRRRKPFARHCR